MSEKIDYPPCLQWRGERDARIGEPQTTHINYKKEVNFTPGFLRDGRVKKDHTMQATERKQKKLLEVESLS